MFFLLFLPIFISSLKSDFFSLVLLILKDVELFLYFSFDHARWKVKGGGITESKTVAKLIIDSINFLEAFSLSSRKDIKTEKRRKLEKKEKTLEKDFPDFCTSPIFTF